MKHQFDFTHDNMLETSDVPIIETVDLTKRFRALGKDRFNSARDKIAVDHVSFTLFAGEILGLLGESGCGKTTLARMLMHLICPSGGRILFNGIEIQSMRESVFRKNRRFIQMVYQNPFDCLDPVRNIKSQLEEPLKIWKPTLDAKGRLEKITRIVHDCGLPESCLTKRPGEFSGGQFQRISIARALLAEPRVLIADEIISALDVPIQNQILQLLMKMKKEHNLSIIFITHDLSVARKVSDRVMIMQSGRIREIGKPETVFSQSEDPNINALASAVFTFSGHVI